MHRLILVLAVLPMTGCYLSPILWIAIALAIHGVLLGFYPED